MSNDKYLDIPTKAIHFSAYSLASGLGVVAGYCILLLTTNYLSKESYANFALYNSVFSLILIFFNFGTKESIYKYASKGIKEQLNKIINWYLKWQILLIGVAVLACLWEMKIVVIFLSFLVLGWVYVVSSYNRGTGDYLKDAIAIPLQRLLWFLMLLVLIFLLQTLTYVHVFFSSLIASLIVFFVVLNKGGLLPEKITRENKPPSVLVKFLLIEAGIVAYTKVDVLILKTFDIQANKIANYYFSLQVFEAAILILAPISYFFFNSYATSQTTNNIGINMLIKYAMVMFGVVLIGHVTWLFFGSALLAMFFPQYSEAYDLIVFYLWALYPISLNYLLSSYLILNDKEIVYALTCGFILILFVVGCSYLVQHYQEWGILYGRLSIEFVLSFILLGLVITTRKTSENNNRI